MWPVTFLFGKQNQRLILRKSDTTELSVNHKLHNFRKKCSIYISNPTYWTAEALRAQ